MSRHHAWLSLGALSLALVSAGLGKGQPEGWLGDLEEARALARREAKPILLVFR